MQSCAKNLESTLSQLKPEAAYFVAENGRRTALIFFDLKEPSRDAGRGRTLFLGFNAQVDFCPAMVFEDLKQAAPALQQAVQIYSRKS